MDVIEPFGNVESTFMSAQICSIVINSIRSIFSKSEQVISPSDFIPQWEKAFDDETEVSRPGAVSDIEGMKEIFKQLAESNNKPKAKTKKRKVK